MKKPAALSYEDILSISSLDELSATDLAQFIHSLRGIEAAPGGPYGLSYPKSQAICLNAWVCSLFERHGKLLPGATAYVQSAGRNYTETTVPCVSTGAVPAQSPAPHKSPPPASSPRLCPYQPSYAQVRRFLDNLPPGLKQLSFPTFQRISTADRTGEISALAQLFAASLRLPKDDAPSHGETSAHNEESGQALASLGAANLLTWMAYTHYDTLIDAARPTNTLYQQIPTANRCLRQALLFYQQAACASAANVNTKIITSLLSEVDDAMALELTTRKALGHHQKGTTITAALFQHLKNDDFKTLLCSKSVAHSIGPLLVCESLRPEARAGCEAALRLYCAARQLADDLHDWLEDFSAGTPNYTVARIIQDAGLTPGTYQTTPLIQNLQLTFWRTTLPTLLHEQLQMLHTARHLLTKNNLMANTADFLRATIQPLELTALQAKKQHRFEKEFVQAQPARPYS